MKNNLYRKVFAAGLLCLSCATASAQRIEAKNQVLNVGQVMFRQPVVAEYELHNASSRDFSIAKVRTSSALFGSSRKRLLKRSLRFTTSAW